MYYYLDVNNEQKGPFSVHQLKSIGLDPETLVWTEGLDSWKTAKEVEDLRKMMNDEPHRK